MNKMFFPYKSISSFVRLIVLGIVFAHTAMTGYCAQSATNIAIPADNGVVVSRYDAQRPSSKQVIYIKDIHCNYGIQSNIADIVSLLVLSCGVDLVALEAASGDVDTSLFSVFPDVTVKQEVCEKFMKRGLLTGVEKLSICESDLLSFTICGVEDPELYRSNLRSFRTALVFSRQLAAHVHRLKEAVHTLKQQVYPPQLYEFQHTASQYHQAMMTFDTWVPYLERQVSLTGASLDRYPNTARLFEAVRIEQTELDYNDLAHERQRLMPMLKKNLTAETFKEVMKLELQYNLGAVSQNEYFAKLGGYIAEYRLQFPQLQLYTRLNKLKTDIHHAVLLAELDELETDIKQALILSYADGQQTQTGRRRFESVCATLESISEHLRAYERLVSLALSDAELDRCLELREKHSINTLIGKVTTIAGLYGVSLDPMVASADFSASFTRALDLAQDFYQLAHERSERMVDNLLAQMDSRGTDMAVLVSGGFHSRAIEDLLEQHNVSYVTIAPRSDDGDTGVYLDLMLSPDLGALTGLSASAEYIGYPVLCSTLLADSDHFRARRSELARSMIEYKGLPVDVYRSQLPDDVSQKLFNKLLILAGLPVDAEPSVALNELVESLSPQTVFEYIIGYDTETLTDEILRSGGNPDTLTADDTVAYAGYLLSFLELAVQVAPSDKSYDSYLIDMIEQTRSPDMGALHAAAFNALFARLHHDGSLSQIEAGSGESLRDLAYRIAGEFAAEFDMPVGDDFQPTDIRIDESMVPLEYDPTHMPLQFEMTIPLRDGTTRTLYVKSYETGDPHELFDAVFDAFGRKQYSYTASRQPYLSYTRFHVTELVAPFSFYDYSQDAGNYQGLPSMLGTALAQWYMLGRIPVNGKVLRVPATDGVPSAIVPVPAYMSRYMVKSLTLKEMTDMFTPLIQNVFVRGIQIENLDTMVEAFIDAFIDELKSLNATARAMAETIKTVPEGVDADTWHAVMQRAARMDEEQIDSIRTALHATFDPIVDVSFAVEDQLHRAAFEILTALAQDAKIDLPDDFSVSNLSIGKRNSEFLTGRPARKSVWFEAVVESVQGRQSFFIKSVDNQPDDDALTAERTALRVLEHLNRKSYAAYRSHNVSYLLESLDRFEVIERIGDVDVRDINPRHPQIERIAQLYGQAIAEALVIGLPDRTTQNMRVVFDGGQPSAVINIDFENVFSEYPLESSLEISLLMAGDFITMLRKAGMEEPRVAVIISRLLQGVEQGLAALTVAARQADPDDAMLASDRYWIQTMERIRSIRTQIPRLISRSIRYVNAKYALGLQSAPSQIRAMAHTVFSDAVNKGMLPLPAGFAPEDIDIESHSSDSMAVIDQNIIRFIVTIPFADGSRRKFLVMSDYPLNNTRDAIRMLDMVTQRQFTYLYSDIKVAQFDGFHIVQLTSDIIADTFTVTDENIDQFASVMGALAAEATIVGLPERTPDVVGLQLYDDQPSGGEHLDLYRAFSSDTTAVQQITDFINYLQYTQRVDRMRQKELMETFLSQFWWTLNTAQMSYYVNKQDFSNITDVSSMTRWKNALRLINATQTKLDAYMQAAIDYVNAGRELNVDFMAVKMLALGHAEEHVKTQVPSYARDVVREMAAAGMIEIADTIAAGDIVVESHNIDHDMVLEYTLPIWCAIRVPLADGTARRFILKSESALLNNRSRLTMAALDRFGRTTYGYYRSKHALPGYTATHVMESVGDMDAHDFLTQTDRMEDAIIPFAAMMGELMAEAYSLGIPDRNLSNIRVIIRDGLPVQLISIDFDEGLDPAVDLVNVVHVQFLRYAQAKGVSTALLHQAAQQFLESFFRTIMQFQNVYIGQAQALHDDVLLGKETAWQELLERMNPDVMPVTDLLEQTIDIMNSDLNYRFGFMLPSDEFDRIISGSAMDAAGDFSLDEQQVSHMAFSIFKELARSGALSMHDQFTEDMLVIEDFSVHDHFRTAEKVVVIRTSIADAAGIRRTYIIKSDSTGNRTTAGIAALQALGRTTGEYHYADMQSGQFHGFHVLEKIGDRDANELDFISPERTEFAYLFGQAMAEAYAIGLHDRSFKNIRLDMDGDIPVAAYNVDFDMSLNDQFDLENIGYEICVKLVMLPRLAGLENDQIKDCVIAFLQGFIRTIGQMQEYYRDHKEPILRHPYLSGYPNWAGLLGRIDEHSPRPEDMIRRLVSQINNSLYAQQLDITFGQQDIRLALEQRQDKPAAEPAFFDIQNDPQLQQLAFDILSGLGESGNITLPERFSPKSISVGKRSLHLVDPYTYEHRMWFAVSFVNRDGLPQEYVIRSYNEDNNTHAAVQAIDALGQQGFACFVSPLSRFGFKGFDVFESVGDMDASSFDLKSQHRGQFAKVLGEAAAVAYVLAVQDRHLGNIRLVTQNGVPVQAINVDLDTALTLSHGWSFEFSDIIRTELLERARKAGLSNEQIKPMMIEYFHGIASKLAELQRTFKKQSDTIRTLEPCAQYPEWENVIERLNSGKLPVLLFIKRMVRQIDLHIFQREYGFSVEPDEVLPQIAYLPSESLRPNNEAQLRNMVHRVFKNLSENGLVSVPDTLSPADVVIDTHNYHEERGLGDSKPIWVEATLPMSDGSRRSFHIKTHTPDNNSRMAVKALELLGRKSFEYYFSDEYLYNINGFHVFEIVGSKDVKDYVPATAYMLDYAMMIGRSMAEAFSISLRDRHPHNLRVVIQNGKPVRVVNIDLDWGLSAQPEDFNVFLFGYLRMLSNVSSYSFHDLIIAYLRGFYTEMDAIQQFYNAHSEQLLNEPALNDTAVWKQCLSRMNPARTSVENIVETIVDEINDMYRDDLDYQLIAVHDVLESGALIKLKPDVMRLVIQQNALSILRNLADTGSIDLDPACTADDLYVMDHNLRKRMLRLEGEQVFFEVSAPMQNGQRKRFLIKPFRAGIDMPAKIAALQALGIEGGAYYASGLSIGKVKGFHVFESVGDIDVSRYIPQPDQVSRYIYRLGKAVADAYVIGWRDRHPGNMRVVLDGDTPRSVINVDYEDILSVSVDNMEGMIFGFMKFDYIIAVCRETQTPLQDVLTHYLRGFYDEFVSLQQRYQKNSEALRTHQLLSEDPKWQETLARLDASITSVATLIESCVANLEHTYYMRVFEHYYPDVQMPAINLSDIVPRADKAVRSAAVDARDMPVDQQLADVAYAVLRDIASRDSGMTWLPLSDKAVTIEQFSFEGDENPWAADAIRLVARIMTTDGGRQEFLMHSDAPSDNTQGGIALYRAMGRLKFRYQFSPLQYGVVNGFHVQERVNGIPASEFSIDSPYTDDIARFYGKMAAESFVMGNINRKPDNLLIMLDSGVPAESALADFSGMLKLMMPVESVYGDFYQHFVIAAHDAGLSADQIHRMSAAYFEEFVRSLRAIQRFYRSHTEQIDNLPELAEHPLRDSILERMNSDVTPPRQVLDSALPFFNGSPIFTDYGITLKVHEIMHDQTQPQKRIAGEALQNEHILTQARRIAFDIIQQLEKSNHLQLSASVKDSDIVIEENNLSDRFVLAHPERMELVVTVPVAGGDEQVYRIQPLVPGRNKSLDAVNALKLLGRLQYEYYAVDYKTGPFGGFHVTEAVAVWDMDEMNWGGRYTDEFSRRVGRAMAEAYVLGLADRTPRNLGVVLDHESFPDYIVNRNLNSAFSYDKDISDIIRFDFITQARRMGIANDVLYTMCMEFITAFKESLAEIQSAYAVSRQEFQTHPSIMAIPERQQLADRLDANKTPLSRALLEVVNAMNRFLEKEKIDFTVDATKTIAVRGLTSDQFDDPQGDVTLAALAHEILLNLEHQGNIELAESFSVQDINVGIRSRHIGDETMETFSSDHLWFEITFALKDGSEKTMYIKSLDHDIKLDVSVEVLKAFGRETFNVYMVDVPEGTFKTFFIMDSIGSVCADTFNFQNPHADRFAFVTGRAVGEAYMFGLGDRHFGNIRLDMDNGVPVKAYNIDMDEPFDEYFNEIDVAHRMYTEIVAPAKRYGLSNNQIRVLLIQFLRGFYETGKSIQATYESDPLHYRNIRTAVLEPGWDDMLSRISSGEDGLIELIGGLIASVNTDPPTARYNFNLRLNDIIDPVSQSDMTAHANIDRRLQELGLRIVNDLAQQGEIDIWPYLEIADIKIEDKHIGNMMHGGIEDRIVFEFSFINAEGERVRYVAKSIRYADLEQLGVRALQALERDSFAWFKSSQTFDSYNGFYVAEHIGQTDVDHFVPASVADAKIAADYIGSATAEAYMLGFCDRNGGNIRFIMGNHPLRAVNIDFTNALVPYDVHISFLLNAFFSFVRNRKGEGYTDNQVLELAHEFLNGFENELILMQEYYEDHKDALISHPELYDHPRWQTTLGKLDATKFDISAVKQQAIAALNETFSLSIIDRAQVETCALECAAYLQRNGDISESIPISPQTVVVGVTNLDSSGVIKGELPLWFEMRVQETDTRSRSFFVKSIMDERDDSILTIEALKSLGLFPGTSRIAQHTVGTFGRFHISEYIGVTDADKFTVTPENLIDFSQKLGQAFGQAYVIGLEDRKLNNIRVVMHQGRVDRLVHIDLEDGFGHRTDGFTLLPVVRFFNEIRRKYGIDAVSAQKAVAAFINGYAYGIGELQRYYDDHEQELRSNELLKSAPQWQSVLEYLDAQEYPVEPMVREVANYLHDMLGIDTSAYMNAIQARFQETALTVLAQRMLAQHEITDQLPAVHESIGAFVDAQGFSSFESNYTAVEMEVEINRARTLFLKTWKPLARRVRDRLRRFARPADALNTNMRFLLYTFFSPSGVRLAEERLGGLVPPMLRAYRAPDGSVSLEKTPRSRECYLQKRRQYVIGDLLAQYKQTNDVQAANELLKGYFAMVEQMWRRGVFDTDLAMWKNHGIDSPQSSDVRLFDLSSLTNNRAAALHVLIFKPHFERIVGKLRTMMPEESVAFYLDIHSEMFTVSHFLKIWNSEDPVPAEVIDLQAPEPVAQPVVPSDDDSAERRLVRSFLARFRLEGRRDIEESIMELIDLCDRTKPFEDISDVIGHELTSRVIETSFAVRDSQLMREIHYLVYSLSRTRNAYRASGLLQVALWEYMSTVALNAPAAPVNMEYHRSAAIHEQSI